MLTCYDILTETLVLQPLVDSFTFKTHKNCNLCVFSMSCYFRSETDDEDEDFAYDAGSIPCDDSVSSLKQGTSTISKFRL